MADNQFQSVESMMKEGVVIDLGWGNKFAEENFSQRFSALYNDFGLREKMCQKGQELVDAKGTQRVTNFVLQKV